MMNEEMKAQFESMNSMEDAYAVMKENGYTGSMEDFEALCAKAADEMSMNIDDMDQVAGGGFGNMVDTVTGALGKTWGWMQENPALTA